MPTTDLPWLEQAWNRTIAKISRTSKSIGAAFPNGSIDGRYNSTPAYDWVAGFWPGLLWLLYQEGKDEGLKEIAVACEKKLSETLQTYDLLHHDVGFMFSLSSVAQYKLLNDMDAKRHGLIAANLLAGRYNTQGEFIRAWPNWDNEDHTGWAIIDCLMNLPLLYWAGNEIKDPRYKHIAIRHADTVIRDFLHPDGSVHHIVTFDPETGERQSALAGQGFAAESAWARGAAWALYGFALSFKYTREVRFLHAAQKVAHFFVAHLPEDHVPYWDFRLPDQDGMPRDSSAAAIAASGLLGLANLLQDPEADFYRSAGTRIVNSLYTNYTDWDSDEEGLLLHATGYYAKGVYVDKPLIYGDYFFVEALVKLRGQKQLFW